MARHARPNTVVTSVVTPAIGATDTDTLVDLACPSDGARLLSYSARIKTVGAGGGTVAIFPKVNGLRVGDAISGIPSASGANTLAGRADGYPQSAIISGTNQSSLTEGDKVEINSVKTGTVTTGVIFILTMVWGL